MKDGMLMLRLDPAQKALWVEQAGKEGVSLSEWIRGKCDAALGDRGKGMVSDERSEQSGAIALSHETPTPVTERRDSKASTLGEGETTAAPSVAPRVKDLASPARTPPPGATLRERGNELGVTPGGRPQDMTPDRAAAAATPVPLAPTPPVRLPPVLEPTGGSVWGFRRGPDFKPAKKQPNPGSRRSRR